MIGRQAEKAQCLRALHHAERPLVLVNVWDVASAKVVEQLGFPAVATSSSAVANALGYEDGEQIDRDSMLDAVWRIASAVNVPVTADIEGAYGLSLEDAAATARGAIEAGAVGVNFEDSTRDPNAPVREVEAHTVRIAEFRKTANALGIPLVINARIDTYLRLKLDDEALERETIRRARAYVEAGADCVFPIFVQDEGAIGRLVREVGAPLNVLATAKTPRLDVLAKLGVKRVSFGEHPLHVALQALRDFASGYA